MQVLACTAGLTVQNGSFVCDGEFVAVHASELAASANSLSANDFRVVAGYFALWFSIMFGVKMVRRMFNT